MDTKHKNHVKLDRNKMTGEIFWTNRACSMEQVMQAINHHELHGITYPCNYMFGSGTSIESATPDVVQGPMQDISHAKYDHINPSHYQQFSQETIDMMIKIWGRDFVAAYCEINAFKYKIRMGEKPDQPIERDLEKAKWYLDKAKKLREAKQMDFRDIQFNPIDISNVLPSKIREV